MEAAEGLYKQARKRRRAGDKIIPLLETANADLTYLEYALLACQLCVTVNFPNQVERAHLIPGSVALA